MKKRKLAKAKNKPRSKSPSPKSKKASTEASSFDSGTQRLNALGRFAGYVAHDFNNVLMIVRGYSDLILKKTSKDDPHRSKIEAIHKASQGAIQLTSQLLAFGHRQLLQPQALNLGEHLERSADIINDLLGDKIKLVTRFPSKPAIVKVDLLCLDQVIINLVQNAKDAIQDTGKVTIEISHASINDKKASDNLTPGQYGVITITDDGCGMVPQIQKRIFEPYFTTKDRGSGKGLGLSTVYGIVTQSGGHITVESQPDKGTTFKVYLLKCEEVPELEPANKEEKAISGKGETILVVENRTGLLQLTSELLTEHGYNVFQAENGREALQLCESQSTRVDLLFTDIMMPEMGGRELAHQLKEVMPHVKVIFTSGYVQDQQFQNDITAGKIHFVSKPYAGAELLQKLREVLDE